ncbi:MAG TPA: ABC transporter permease subunit [Armatimonadota bacterium]|jgi:ABC-type transport system involved in multi-copper enzyme maturation permease subunit
MALERVMAVAGLTMKESARKKVAIGMMVCSILMTLALGLVARAMQANESSEMGLAFAVQGLLRLVATFIWVMAIFISVTAIPPELERRTTYTLFAKPLDRWEYVLGKYVGCCALLAANVIAIAAIVALMLGREDPTLTVALMKNLATFFISYSALIALALALTLVLPMAVAAMVSLGLYFLSSVYGFGLQVAQTPRLPHWARALGAGVYHIGRLVTPRVNWLNTDRPFYEVSGHTQLEAALCVMAYSVAVLALGTLAFSRREL